MRTSPRPTEQTVAEFVVLEGEVVEGVVEHGDPSEAKTASTTVPGPIATSMIRPNTSIDQPSGVALATK